MRLGRLYVWMLAGFSLGATAGGCATNPVTGERQLSLISESQEIQMGQQAAQEVSASIGLVANDALQSYVSGIGTRLAAASERPQLPWAFAVVDDPTPNAFALPGGFIFVTRGLLSLMDSEAELASVLGHEVGHVTAKHSVSQISRAQLAQIGLGVGTILVPEAAGLGNLAGAGLQLLFLKHGRSAEHQADELGFRYALGQGYDVREMADVFRSLERAGEAAGQSPLPSWLSTHPFPAERIQRTNERVAALTQPLTNATVGRDRFLNTINGLVYGVNPRNGFFRGSLFMHPDLRFRIEFPQGWQTHNMTQAVVAASAQQDAIIQLTLTQGTPDAAARQFAAQQGVTATAPARETIGGNQASVLQFEAQTEQGVLRGLAVFLSHQNRTYQLLGYTSAQRYSAYSAVFRQSFGSFATLTDPQALNIQPNRIEIVRVPQTMTLAQFHQRYPSAIDVAELALINGLSGADASIPSGTMVKRVAAG